MLALLSDYKPVIRVVEKLDLGMKAPKSDIEARILDTLEVRENNNLETYII